MAIQYHAIAFLGALHALALASLPYIWLHGVGLSEACFHIAGYFLGGLGITVLYHRAWAHNAVRLSRPVEYFFAVISTLVPQTAARSWVSSHIQHHQHTDSDLDPYNIGRGFWWAHFEWIILSPTPPVLLPARLDSHPVMLWQERYYWPISALMNIIIPVGISLACGAPWWGGLLLSSLRLVLASHVVYSVNSVCHYWGTRPYSTEHSARDVWWFPFALGEQYHNYHHTFPRDYRHGIGALDFDPTKWVIAGLARLGLAHDLVLMGNKQVEASQSRVRVRADQD